MVTPKRKGTRACDYNLKECYEHYKKTAYKPVSRATYRGVLKDFFDARFDRLVLEDEPFYMPNRLGVIYMQQKKIQIVKNSAGEVRVLNSKIDFASTNKARKEYKEKVGEEVFKNTPRKELPLIHFTNLHSNMYRYEFVWGKKPKVRNIGAYVFNFCREKDRKLAGYCKDPKVHLSFIEIPSYKDTEDYLSRTSRRKLKVKMEIEHIQKTRKFNKKARYVRW